MSPGPERPPGPSPEQIARQRAESMRAQADEEVKRGHYPAALAHLEQARGLWPDLYNIDLDINNLRGLIADRQERNAVRAGLEQGAGSFRYAPAAGSAATGSSLDFIESTGTGAFGTNKSDPRAADLGSTARLRQVHPGSAAGQAQSAKQSGRAAAVAADKALSNCQWDTAGCRDPDPADAVRVDRAAVQTPAASELASHIPDDPRLRKDPAIRQSLAWFERLERQKAGYARDLADLQRRIDGGQTADAGLAAKKAAVESALKKTNADQATAVASIKKRIADRGSRWIETPPPSGAAPARSAP